MIATNKINTHDILTADFLDCEAYAFLNKWWDIKTPKWPDIEFINELISDIKKDKPKYFNLASFKCRRYKTNQLLTSINAEAIEYIRKSTIYFKNDNTFWWIKDNGITKVNDGRLLIDLELDWIASDWASMGDIDGNWIFDVKPLT